MDALSEVLKTIRLHGAVYLNAEFSAPWCATASYGTPLSDLRVPGADHIIFFHCMLSGICLVRLASGGNALRMSPGDLVFFPHDHRHLLGSDLGLMPVDSRSIEPVEGSNALVQLRHGGGGECARFVCGYLACNRRVSRSLLAGLPEIIHVSLATDPANAWLLDLLALGVRESVAGHAGSKSILTKLSELLFAEALRRYAEQLPAGQPGWLSGLRDPVVGRALALMHQRPAHPWTVQGLARAVGASRSALAQRFGERIEQAPMHYLTSHRLALAAQALRAGKTAVADIAASVGYSSEAAFTRAFKREFGSAPAIWRRVDGDPGAAARAAAPS